MTAKKYTAAIIGTGRIGFTLGFDKKREQPASHTMALLSNKRIQIVAGCDSDAENLARWHKYVPKASVFSDCKEMLSSVSAGSADCPESPPFPPPVIYLEDALCPIQSWKVAASNAPNVA